MDAAAPLTATAERLQRLEESAIATTSVASLGMPSLAALPSRISAVNRLLQPCRGDGPVAPVRERSGVPS